MQWRFTSTDTSETRASVEDADDNRHVSTTNGYHKEDTPNGGEDGDKEHVHKAEASPVPSSIMLNYGLIRLRSLPFVIGKHTKGDDQYHD